jgi:CheY-like chemotaxis protein
LAVAAQSGKPNSTESQPGSLRVVVADDERDAVLTLGLLLRSEGMEVRLVRTGQAALAAVADFHPDAVLLDIGMPDRSGYDVAQELSRRYGDECPVLIAVTGLGKPDDKEMAEISGFHHFVTKPYDAQALVRLLVNLKRHS